MIQVSPLQPDSQVPLYRQLYERFRRAIETGELRHGDRIPPTRELAQLAGVNRATAAAAYELLESDGLIAGHVGRGSFVQSAPLAAQAGAISFSTSRPPEHLFPIDEFRETASEVLSDPALGRILQLGAASGYAPLKRYLFDQARAEGAANGEDDIVITNGCQQALDLVQRVATHAGGAVLVEDPTYAGLKNVFERQGMRLTGLPVEEGGVEPEEIERRIRREQPLALVITPNFQNPTGATIPMAARERIARVVADTGVLLVEIDVYRDFAYGAGETLPTIKQLLPEGAPALVLRSFSKVAFPGLRTGWVIGPKSWIGRLAEAKQWSDLHADQLSQAILLRFAESGRLDRHIARMRSHGQACLKEALEGCARELPAGSFFTKPRGGMNLWVRLPDPLDAQELLPLAQREGVSYQPGRHFLVGGRRDPGALRLSFTGMPPAQVRQGLTILGRVARGEWARRKADRESAIALV